MIDFAVTTPFSFVRRLAAGQEGPSVYMLVSEASALRAIQADIEAEVQVQLGGSFRSEPASAVQVEKLDEILGSGSVLLITLDQWTPRLIDSLDRNIVLLSRAGKLLLLADHELAEHALAVAPNLRNRLADVLAITPDAR